MINSETHFDTIAKDYDSWKSKNWYYYQNLISLYKSLIPVNGTVLEIGTGTGDVLASLKPVFGLGLDESEGMIQVAEKKHAEETNLSFVHQDIMSSNEIFNFGYIFLADVLEHVFDLPAFVGQIHKRSKFDTKIIISVANPLWEPVLMLAEKLKMKMPEGPHKRLAIKETEKIFSQIGFSIREKGYRLLIPKKLFFSGLINNLFYKNNFFAPLGFIVYWVLSK